ncbi:MAG: pur operon repressor [Synergistaceae bacterium]|nr:pur operon repressor [Synergistaceae bacterium]
MRGQRTERLVRMASRLLLFPAKQVSLTQMANAFQVSKTVISDDVAIIDNALAQEELGHVIVDRGRSGGASFSPALTPGLRRKWLETVAALISQEERVLPGGLLYYSDVLFDPSYALPLGFALASDFASSGADVVVTSEVKGIPLALYVAHALGVPLAVCRFRNRASDGAAVGVHFPTLSGDVRTMYMGTRQLSKGAKVLIIDDFMRGGSTIAGMLLVAREFGADVVGTGVFIAAAEPAKKAVSDYRSLFQLLRQPEGQVRIVVND